MSNEEKKLIRYERNKQEQSFKNAEHRSEKNGEVNRMNTEKRRRIKIIIYMYVCDIRNVSQSDNTSLFKNKAIVFI
jgi:hypothetical protein